MAAPVRFETNPEHPELAQAASLLLAILAVTKTASLADLDYTIPANVDLDDDQLDLLDEHRGVLALLRSKTPDSPAAVTLAACPQCGRWILVGTSGLTNCSLTPRCTGKPVRAAKAVKVKA